MQYSVLIILALLVAIFINFRAFRYISGSKNYFIEIDDSALRKYYEGHEKKFSYDEFKGCWIAISNNLNCPKGKVIRNSKIREFQRKYPFPEMFIDDICEGFEVLVKSELSLDMSFCEVVVYFLAVDASVA